MRKILSLFVILFLSITSAMAQEAVTGTAGTLYTSPAMTSDGFANGTKFYTIEINRNNCQLDSRYLPTVRQKKATACDENKWAVYAKGSGYQFINKATKKALTFASTANDAAASLTDDLEDANSVFEFTTSQNSRFASGFEVFRIAGTTEAYPNDKDANLSIWASAQALWGWGSSETNPGAGDAGSQFKFTMVEELVLNTFTFEVPNGVTVTYNGTTYTNGGTVDVMGSITATDVTVSPEAPAGSHYDITVDAATKKVIITIVDDPIVSISEINPNKAYCIYTDARGGLTIKSADDTRLWGTKENGVGQNVDGNNHFQQFAFINYNEKIYLYSIGAGKFVNSSETGKLEDVPADAIDFKNPGNGTVRLVFTSGSAINFNLGGSNQMAIGTWSTKDPGNSFRIAPVADFDPAPVIAALNAATYVDVTYMITNVDGVEVPYVVKNVKTGQLAAIPEINGYFSNPVMTDTDCIISETNNIFHVTGTWEFPFEAGKVYTMKSTASANNYICDGTHAWYNNSVAAADNNDAWQFAHVDGTLDLFTVKNCGYDKYAVLSGSGRNAVTFAETTTVWSEGTGATSYFRVVKQATGFNLQHPGDATTNVGSHVDNMFGSWQNANSATNAASINTITETTLIVPAEKSTVTYNYNYNGEFWKSISNEQPIGETIAEAPAIAFGTLSYDNTAVVAATGTTVEVEVTENLPFEAAADYASITKWYDVRLHSNQTHYQYWDGSAVTFSDDKTTASANAYAWAFIGNLKDGFKMVNYVAGEGLALNNATPCGMDADGYAFPIAATTENVAGGFCLADGTNFLNFQGNAVARWHEADAGSTFRLNEVEILAGPDWEGLTAAIEKALKYQIGDNLGQYTYMYLDTPDNETWNDFISYCYDLNEQRTADVDDVEYAIEGLNEMVGALQINLPKKGQLIRIKASNDWLANTYLAGATASNGRLSFVQNPDFSAEAEDNTIWIYDGQYLINYANGLTVATTAAQYGHGTLAMYPNTTAIAFRAADNGSVGRYNIRFAGNRNLYTNKNLYTDAGAGTDATEGYNFELEDATYYFFLDFGDKGWASAYFPIAVAANPEYGIDAAYYIKNDPENDCFKAEEVSGIIKPFTPVIIKVNSEAHSGTPFVKGAPDYTLEPEPSVLKGALWKQATPEGCCVFNVVDSQPGFYGYTGTTLKHMKAYYEMPVGSSASALRINFGEEGITTAIQDALDKAEFSGDVYDLQGRRINGVQQGVFVKNGRKIVK